MSKQRFQALLAERRPLIFDGAMGTVLMHKNFGHILAEKLNLSHPELITGIHQEYIAAGADIIETNTFNASLIKLQEHGLSDKLEAINAAAVQNARKAAGTKVLVAGSLGPTGKLLEPLGPVSFAEAYHSYQTQAAVLLKNGVDLFIVETISDVQEMRAALLAIKDICDLPVICSMTYNEEGKTLTGTDMYTAAVILSRLGADVLSVNCSIGPEGVLRLLDKYHQKLYEVNTPLMVMPNAGMPEIIDDKVVYTLTPDKFSGIMDHFRKYGVSIYGGCCGTTPPHIAALARMLKKQKIIYRLNTKKEVYFASRTKVFKLSEARPILKIGESLNPTARKAFAEDLKNGREDYLREQAREQTKQGAHLLDINVGVPELDQKALMKKAVLTLSRVTDTPICVDSDTPAVIEEALRNYPGLVLINSVNGKKDSLEKIVPLAKKYGACLIALALDEKGIPPKAEDRFKIIDKMLQFFKSSGYDQERVLFDGLVMAIATEPEAAKETIKITEILRKKDLKSSVGVSNVSFGLPLRKNINNVMIHLLKNAGLTAAICNTATYKDIQFYNQEERLAAEILLGKSPLKKYLIVAESNKSETPVPQKEKKAGLPAIYDAVIEGEDNTIVDLITKELQQSTPEDIMGKALLPALDKVGEYFSSGRFYLPQIIASANTVKKAFELIKLKFPKSAQLNKGTAIISTVEGDIHDIGKNIVAMMLENHGFRVIDLGKDVPADKIVEAVKQYKADIVLLSALLTTTMLKMKEVKQKLEASGLMVPVMVGGAVVTADFAQKFGAYYTGDAAAAAAQVKKLLNK